MAMVMVFWWVWRAAVMCHAVPLPSPSANARMVPTAVRGSACFRIYPSHPRASVVVVVVVVIAVVRCSACVFCMYIHIYYICVGVRYHIRYVAMRPRARTRLCFSLAPRIPNAMQEHTRPHFAHRHRYKHKYASTQTVNPAPLPVPEMKTTLSLRACTHAYIAIARSRLFLYTTRKPLTLLFRA